MLHLTSTADETVRTAIDQCAECGFEMVIFSFGSGLNMEDTSVQNIQKFKAFADYAHSKRIRIGGYSLLASRSVAPEHDVINPATGKTGGTIFGNSPCLCSSWGLDYFKRIKQFLKETGFDLLEHDGSYPGDVCASTKHPGHRGKQDSQWRQFELIRDLYVWCRKNGIYLNVPDTYFLCGSNKVGMGYRETNWSLPRSLQHIHARQNMFDGTWEKLPSMGWMFVPLVQYHGGGADALAGGGGSHARGACRAGGRLVDGCGGAWAAGAIHCRRAWHYRLWAHLCACGAARGLAGASMTGSSRAGRCALPLRTSKTRTRWAKHDQQQ
jgi:hypothetical protein